jgi:hypothetical protein
VDDIVASMLDGGADPYSAADRVLDRVLAAG